MKIAHVIGRVTLNSQDPSYKGGRFLLAVPLTKEQLKGAPLLPLTEGSSVIVYDNLGAGVGDVIGFSESGEASAAFPNPTPVDAFNCAIIDRLNYTPPS